MNTLLSLGYLLHIIGIGLLLERRPDFFRTRVLGLLVVYFFFAHLGLALIITTFPELIDPRHGLASLAQ